ncbi:hypothetical protein EVAR_96146_1 [Eumeta japonica]|uniref:Uncharacterized protein n=1 Tax=Eumeta variegata TaxID=151549 RepID=A0A4C1VL01_EUMVA|nr:hypothetical protein EVAR_96146_1 [Eumeta japonica]
MPSRPRYHGAGVRDRCRARGDLNRAVSGSRRLKLLHDMSGAGGAGVFSEGSRARRKTVNNKIVALFTLATKSSVRKLSETLIKPFLGYKYKELAQYILKISFGLEELFCTKGFHHRSE